MMQKILGCCLCGEVRFTCENTFTQFHLCHCTQCQKTSGSAHVSNLFTAPNNIEWLAGQASVKRYDVPGRLISTAFCCHCGSPVPYVSITGEELIVPAGVLNSTPSLKPQDHIFWCERAAWYEPGIKAEKFDGLPE